MKKIIVSFIVCLIVIFFAYQIKNESISNLVQSIPLFNTKKIEMYNNDFKINKLQIKNSDYYYNKLDEKQKIIYSNIAINVNKLNKKFKLYGYEITDYDAISKDTAKAINAFFNDHPEVFYLNSKYKLNISESLISKSVSLELSYSVKNIYELDDNIDKISKEIELYKFNEKDIFNLELLIHDKLAKDVSYSKGDLDNLPDSKHTIYGAFIEKDTVCDGFTKALQILLDKVGIESILVSGKIDSGPHALNMVKLDNKWYYLDLTSNKYIKENNATSKNIAHTYFNVSEKYILKTHTIDNINELYKADSEEYNYFNKTNSYITSIDNFDWKLKNIVELQKNNDKLEFRTDYTNDVPNKIIKVLYDINFNNYKKQGSSVKLQYYNLIDTYIVEKK